MRHPVTMRAASALVALGLASSFAASAAVITDNLVATQAGLVGGMVPLDISSVVSGLSTVNSYSTNFASNLPGAYTGTLTATVYGNTQIGSGLNNVLIVYSFTGNGPSGIDTFEFGLDSGSNLDYSDMLASTQGTVGDMRSLSPSLQGSPLVTLTDNLVTNDTQSFAFNADPLGGFSPSQHTDTFGWYVRSLNGAVNVGFVDVLVTDFSGANTKTLAFVDIPGQPDLNVPGPGALGLLGVGMGLAGVRRRRA